MIILLQHCFVKISGITKGQPGKSIPCKPLKSQDLASVSKPSAAVIYPSAHSSGLRALCISQKNLKKIFADLIDPALQKEQILTVHLLRQPGKCYKFITGTSTIYYFYRYLSMFFYKIQNKFIFFGCIQQKQNLQIFPFLTASDHFCKLFKGRKVRRIQKYQSDFGSFVRLIAYPVESWILKMLHLTGKSHTRKMLFDGKPPGLVCIGLALGIGSCGRFMASPVVQNPRDMSHFPGLLRTPQDKIIILCSVKLRPVSPCPV